MLRSALLATAVLAAATFAHSSSAGQTAPTSNRGATAVYTGHTSADSWYVWYRCGSGRWNGVGPMSYYHALRAAEDYRGSGCSAYVSK
jgi:hypothetical protein